MKSKILLIALLMSGILFSDAIPNLTDINTSVAEDDLILIYDSNAAYGDRNKKISFENLRYILLHTVANDSAFSAKNNAGTSFDALFKYNQSDQMEILKELLVGITLYGDDPGLINPKYFGVTSSSTKGSEHGAGLGMNGSNSVIDYCQADGTGGIQAVGELSLGFSLSTTDTTFTTIQTITTTSESMWSIDASCTGAQDDFTDGAFFRYNALFKNDGGTLSRIGTVNEDVSIESGATAFQVTKSGTNIIVQVRGVASETWNWRCNINVQRIK